MATYAAFKHVELHKVGYGKNRVPNAPRGCINEIFGGESSPNSKPGNGNGSETPSRPKDTHSRLFGPVARPQTAVRDNLKSNISFGNESPRLPSTNGHANGHTNGHAPQTNGHETAPQVVPVRRNPVTGDGICDSPRFWRRRRPRACRGTNPLSAEGHKSMNGEINTVTALNGNSSSPVNHNRVPPGGYSSGLW